MRIKWIATVLLLDSTRSTALSLQWLESSGCEGPPNVIYEFSSANINSSMAVEGEKWPAIYSLSAREGPIDYCGNLAVPLVGRCCYSSVDRAASEGFLSGSTFLIRNSSEVFNSLPKTSPSARYCMISSVGELTGGTGYRNMLVLADGKCIEKMVCNENGVLSIYGASSCTGDAQSVQLTDEFSSIDPIIVDSKGMFLLVNAGQKRTQWIASTPGGLLVPNTNSPLDIGQHIFYSLCVIAFVWSAQSIHRRKGHQHLFHLMVLQASWILYVFFQAFYIYTPFSTTLSLTIVYEMLGVWFNIATLLETLFTTYLFFQVIQLRSKWKSYLASFCIVFFHLITAGSNYFSFCWYYPATCGGTAVVNVWQRLNIFWLAFLFVWNCVPVMVATLLMLRGPKQTYRDAFKTLIRSDKTFCTLILMQLLFALMYFVSSLLQYWSDFYFSDRGYLLSNAFEIFCLCQHSLINIRLLKGIYGFS